MAAVCRSAGKEPTLESLMPEIVTPPDSYIAAFIPILSSILNTLSANTLSRCSLNHSL